MNPPLTSSFTVYTNPSPEQQLEQAGDPSDRELAGRVLKSLYSLQEAMDAAVLGGLIIEPCFKQIANRFKEFGNDNDSYVTKVEIYRKLA